LRPQLCAGRITAPEYKYDDYALVDAAGKIVVVFDREPQENDPKSVFAGTAADGARLVHQQGDQCAAARRQGDHLIAAPSQRARISDPCSGRKPKAIWAFPRSTPNALSSSTRSRMPAKDLAALQQGIDKDLTPQSVAPAGARAHITTDVVRKQEDANPQCDRDASRLRSHSEERVDRGGAHYGPSGPGQP